METEIPEGNERETAPTGIEWEHRVLCSDGNCIGVIGPDGCCKECGKEYEGTLAEDHFAEAEERSPEDSSLGEADPSPEEEVPLETAESNAIDEVPADDDWQDRALCSDGNCIGVIGPDGKCKECGKPSKG